jgi:hypothetical protein
MGPYLAGMYAAYHTNKVNEDPAGPLSNFVEWVAFALLLTIGFFGTDFPVETAALYYVYYCLHRIIFGWCVAYLTAVMLSVKAEEPLGIRPSAMLRCFFSLGCWVPLATLSYSFYVFNPFVGFHIAQWE